MTTITSIFKDTVERHGQQTAAQLKQGGKWVDITWAEIDKTAKAIAGALVSKDLEPKARVAILSNTRIEWITSDLGVLMSDCTTVPIYQSSIADDVQYIINDAEVKFIFAEDESQIKKLWSIKDQIPNVSGVVCFEAISEEVQSEVGDWVMILDDFKATGETFYTENQSQVDERSQGVDPSDLLTLVYTSGTTGRPKGVMISHDNILFEARVAMDMIPGMGMGGERIISYLPLSHVAGMMVDIISPITVAATTPGYATLHFARPYDLKAGTLGDRLRAVRPTLFLGVPRVWEKIQEKIMAKSAANPTTGIKNSLKLWALGLGLEHQVNCQLGGSGEYGTGYAIAEKLVLSKVKLLLGLDQCKFCFTGAAPIKTETLQFYGRLGLNINEVYGMSECTGATTWSTDLAHRWGSCGWAVPSTEVSVRSKSSNEEVLDGNEGEICYRGRHIMMGYMANPDLGEEHMQLITSKNRGSIDKNGWLHSGDKGQRDVDGMLKITGRYKELIIGAGGENVAPVPVEDGVKSRCPAISNIMMYGDKMKYNVAIVTLKTVGATGELPGTDELDPVAAALDSSCTTLTQAMDSVKIIQAITDAIIATNKDPKCVPMAPAKIQKFTILPTDFSVVTDELTPTFKLKRSVAAEKYMSTIMGMYDSKEIYVKYNA